MYCDQDGDELAYRELHPHEAHELYTSGEVVILDVRTLPEWRGGHIPGSVHIPLDELAARHQELDPEREVLVVCAHGIRSAAAGQWLSQAGFDNVANIRYGMSAWPGPVDYPNC